MLSVEYWRKVKARAKEKIFNEYFSIRSCCETEKEKEAAAVAYIRWIDSLNRTLDAYEVVDLLQEMKFDTKVISRILIHCAIED